MSSVDKRVHYFHGQLLKQEDFQTEQEYHSDRQERHNRLMHTPGIAEGLDVHATLGGTTIQINAGTAVNKEGKQIVLLSQHSINGLSSYVGKICRVVIAFGDEEKDESTDGVKGFTRYQEMPKIEVIPDQGWTETDPRIPLGRLKIGGDGTVQDIGDGRGVDTSIRRSAGVRIGDSAAIKSITLTVDGVDASQHPRLSGGAANRADLQGNLRINKGYVILTEPINSEDEMKKKLDELPPNSLVLGSPDGDQLMIYWKDKSGNKYYAQMAGNLIQ